MQANYSLNQASSAKNDKNYKSLLKERADAESLPQPSYAERVTGPSHAPTFESVCTFAGVRLAGTGITKKEAQQSAAKAMYEHMTSCAPHRPVEGLSYGTIGSLLPSVPQSAPARFGAFGPIAPPQADLHSAPAQRGSSVANLEREFREFTEQISQQSRRIQQLERDLAARDQHILLTRNSHAAQAQALGNIEAQLRELRSSMTRDRFEGQCGNTCGSEGFYAQYVITMPVTQNFDYSTVSQTDHVVDIAVMTYKSSREAMMAEPPLDFPKTYWEIAEARRANHVKARADIKRYRERCVERVVEEADRASSTVTFSTIMHKRASPKNQTPPKNPKIILVQPGSPLPKCRSYDTIVYGGPTAQAEIREVLASYQSAPPEIKGRMVRAAIIAERDRDRRKARDSKAEQFEGQSAVIKQAYTAVKNRVATFVSNVETSASNVADLSAKAKSVVDDLSETVRRVAEKSKWFAGGAAGGFLFILPSCFIISYAVVAQHAAGFATWQIALINAALMGLSIGWWAHQYSDKIQLFIDEFKKALYGETMSVPVVPLPRHNPAFEGQSSSITKTAGKLIAALLSIAMIGKAPSDKRLKEFASCLAHFDKLREGSADVASVAIEAIQDIFNRIARCAGWDEIQLAKSGFEEVDLWLNDCLEFANKAYLGPDRGGHPVNSSTGLTLHLLRQQGIVLEGKVMQNRAMAGAHSLIRSCQARLASLAGRWEQANVKMTGPRTPPLSIMVRGESGVGKSSMCFPLMLCVLHHIFTITGNVAGLRALKEDQYSLFYSRAVEQKYWDGYTNQWVCVWDDFFQSKNKNGADSEHMDWIRCYNIWPAPLHMANLEAKGNTFWTSRIAFATTNVAYSSQDSVILEGVRCADAIRRRIDVDLTLSVNPDYVSDELKKADSDRTHWRIDRSKLKLGNKYDINIPVFHDNRRNVDYTFTQVVDLLVHSFIERQEQSEEFKSSLHEVHQRDSERFSRDHKEILSGLKIKVDPKVFSKEAEETQEFIDTTPELKAIGATVLLAPIAGFSAEKMAKWVSGSPHPSEVCSEPPKPKGREDLDMMPDLVDHDDDDEGTSSESDYSDPWADAEPIQPRYEGQSATLQSVLSVPESDWPQLASEKVKETYLRKEDRGQIAEADGWIIAYLNDIPEELPKKFDDNPVSPWLQACMRMVVINAYSSGLGREVIPAAWKQLRPSIMAYEEKPNPVKGAYLQSLMNIDLAQVVDLGFWGRAKSAMRRFAGRILRGIHQFKKDHPTAWVILKWGTIVFAALVAVVGMVALFRHKSESAEGQSVHRADPKAQGKKIVAPTIRQRFSGQAFDDVFDGTANNIATSLQTKNLWTFNTGLHSSGVLFVCDNIFLAPRHFQAVTKSDLEEGLITRDSVARLEHKLTSKIVQVGITDLLDAIPLVETEENDIVVGIIKSTRQLQSRADVVDYFLMRSTASKISREQVKATLAVLPTQPMKAEQICLEAKIMDRAVDVYVEGYEAVVRDGYRYSYPTRKGDCMSALLLRDPSTRKQKILGVHVAGDGKTGITQAVYQEDLRSAIKKVRADYTKPLVSDPVDPPYHVQMFETPADNAFPPITVLKKPVVSASKTRIIESKLAPFLADTWPHTKAPAVLKPTEVDGVLVNPFEESLSKYDKVNPVINLDLVRECATDYISTMHEACPDLPPETGRRVFSKEEAVIGIKGCKWWSSMGRSTSVGFVPWFSKMKDIGPDTPGKTIFFGTGAEYDLSNPNALELFARVDSVIEKLKKGERDLFAFKDFLKDELRPLAKVKAAKTRFVSPAPIDLTILFRMYFGAFCVFMQKGAGDNGSAIGVNPYNLDWQRVWSKLHEVGNNLYAGDFIEYDSRLLTDVVMAFCDEANKFYDDGPVNVQIRQMLFLEITNSRHVFLRMLYEWIGSMPSGNPLTAFINTFFTNVVKRIVWVINGARIAEFRKHVRIIALGDDHVYCVSHAARDIMRPDRVAAAYEKLGLGYTAADKSECTGAFMAPGDITFLKRRWRYEPQLGRMVAPLELETIRESIQWTKKGEESDVINQRNFETMLCELALHGKEVFDRDAPIMCRAYDLAYNAHFRIRDWRVALAQVAAYDSPFQAESLVM